jgi:hypothetical protein
MQKHQEKVLSGELKQPNTTNHSDDRHQHHSFSTTATTTATTTSPGLVQLRSKVQHLPLHLRALFIKRRLQHHTNLAANLEAIIRCRRWNGRLYLLARDCNLDVSL